MTLKEYQAQLIAALTPESLAEMRAMASGWDGKVDLDREEMAAALICLLTGCHFAEVDIDDLARSVIARAQELNEELTGGER